MGSIGVTTAGRGDARTASELLRDADTARYAAKNERFGVRVFGEHHRQAVVERMGDRTRASEGPCTIERLDDSLTQLRDLAALGASLVIDEFGTGRSSLARVKKLDMIDGIKIDPSFIIGIPAGHVDMAIIDGIMVMAEALGHRVVAEGVETFEQAQAPSLGVDLVQRYLFARPEPAGSVEMDMLMRGPAHAAGGLDEVPVRRIA